MRHVQWRKREGMYGIMNIYLHLFFRESVDNVKCTRKRLVLSEIKRRDLRRTQIP